ncbi:MAG: hypothetical protein ABSD44_04185 [Terracidiphilus sp.]
MIGSNFMQGWITFVGALAIIALILTAFGIMLGIVKPADLLKYVGAILGVVVALMVLPGVLLSAWSGMALWRQIALIAIGVGAFRWMRPRRHSGNKKRE